MARKKKSEPPKEAVATKELKHKVVQNLREIPIPTWVCQKLGIPKATYYKWRKIDQAFKDASDEAIVSGKLNINDVAKSQLINKIKNGDYRSISFWLKHNDADFNPKMTLEIKDEKHTYSQEQLDEWARAMRNAGLVGVTLHHQKLARLYQQQQEEDERLENERAEYDEDYTEETSDSPTEKPRKGGVNIAEFVKKRKAKE